VEVVATAGAAIVDAVVIIASIKMVGASMVCLVFFLSLLRLIISLKEDNTKDKKVLLIEGNEENWPYLIII
jgi:hypothetical protein